MKPLKLEIEGLNSFESRQVLDFTKLGNGVFGVFGKTGSGKSTILDAIILSLYGDVERSKQNIDFINKKKKKTIVSLEFNIFSAGENKTYLVKRSFQIKKNGKDVDSNAELFEKINNDYAILTEGTSKVNEKIHEIIKLGKNEFIKCIALPQGEFSAFLQAKPSERTEILSNIFNLSKYGESLCNKVKEKLNDFDKQIAVLSSNLALVDYANDEQLNGIKIEYEETSSAFQENSKKLKTITSEHSKSVKLLENKTKLEKLNKELQEMSLQSNEMNNLEIEIDKNINANKIQNDYQKLQKDKSDKQELETKISSLNENRLKTESEKIEAENDFNEFKINYDKKLTELNSKLDKINELMNLEKEELSLRNDENILLEKIEENRKLLEIKNSELIELTEKISQIDAEINEIDAFISKNKQNVEISYILEQTKNIESELILIEEFLKFIEQLYDQTNSELTLAKEEYNSAVSQDQKINEKIKQIQDSIEKAFEFEDVDKTNFNKVRSCDKQIDAMTGVKIKVGLIDQNIITLKTDKANRLSIIESLDSQIIEQQNNLTSIEKKLEEKEKLIERKSVEREELLGSNFFSLVSNQLKIGDHCPICSNKVIQKSFEQVFDIKPISNEIVTEKSNLRNLKFERDRIFTNLVSLKARNEFEKAQVQIDSEEIESFETNKLILYREFVNTPNNTKENFDQLYSILQSTTESLESLIDLQDSLREEQLKIIISKAESGTKISIYSGYIDSYNDILYTMQKKKAEREFAIINVNEQYSNLKDYKKQIAEGRNIELVIDEKKEHKFNLKDEQTKLIINKSTLERIISTINADISVLNEKANLKKEQYTKIQQSIFDFGIEENSSVSKEQINILNNINELKDTYSKKEMTLESNKELLSRITRDYDINVSIFNNKKLEIENLETKISNLMIDCNFASNDELESHFENQSLVKEKQNRLNDYKTKLKLITTQKTELEKDNYDGISEEKISNLKDDIDNLSEQVTFLSEKVGRTSAEYEKTKQDNETRKTIVSELEVVKHNYDLAKELSQVLKGKALAEYVAEEYLQDITDSANQKLSILLDGKYLIQYKNKEFLIQDNFNDGIIRSASTLSGGETFLVSLSLALAISDSISMLSSRNIEFFFLDEGFGTLDPELCEVVVSALYKLESKNLNIGLISHITELEEAIKNKVYITKTNFGSKINIEHTL